MRKYVDHKFWQYISKTNTVKVIPVELFEFLSQNGFKYHTLGNTGVDVPVEVEGKFIVLRIMNDLKKFTIEYIKTQDFPLQLSKTEQKLIVNALIISNDLFLEKYLQFLDPYNPNIIGDDQYVSRVYFKNKYIEITRDKVHPKEYIELEGAVYKSEIIDFAIDDTILFSDYKDSDFYIFLGCICDNGDIEVDEDKLTSLKSIIGYLLHTYKDPSFPRAVIFLDPSNEINPNGRTGKGLICKALGHTRKLAKEDGKFFGVREKYAFSLVEWDTKIFQLDDVKKNFDFESLFPAISEGIRVEKKYENKFYIPYSHSPKIVLTTNYAIHGEGHSHEGRKIEFELSEYFDDDHTPFDQFQHRLFDDWNESEWNKFYALMIDCIKLFLSRGIIDPPEVDTNLKRLKQETPPEFLSFMDENISTNQRYDKKAIFNSYCSKNPGTDLLIQKTFTSWIKLYARAKGFDVKEPHSGSTEYFILAEKL